MLKFKIMKEVINISLSGISFMIEKDAYEVLCKYTNTLEAEFASKGEEGKEIIADIEARIAEILMADKEHITSIIVLNDVEKVIEQMGYPEADDSSESETKNIDLNPKKRKLYRKKEGKILGGVLNGIATYFNVDVLILRLAYIVVSLMCMSINFLEDWVGYLHMAYLILWMIIPEAKTVIQNLEMEGGDINVSSINNKYVTNAKKGEENVLASKATSTILKVLKFILLAIASVMGLFLLLSIITFVVFVMGFAFSPNATKVLFEWNTIPSTISTFLALILPMVIILLLLINVLFTIKTKRVIWVISIVVWLVAAIFSVVSFAINASTPRFYKTNNTELYSSNTSDTLYIKTLGDGDSTNIITHKFLYREAIYKYEISQDSTIKVVMSKSIKANNIDDAEDILNNTEIPYEIKDDTLFITTGFTKGASIFKNQHLYYTIYCPKDRLVIIDKNINRNGIFPKPEKKSQENKKNKDKKEPKNTTTKIKIEANAIDTTNGNSSSKSEGSLNVEIVTEEIKINE